MDPVTWIGAVLVVLAAATLVAPRGCYSGLRRLRAAAWPKSAILRDRRSMPRVTALAGSLLGGGAAWLVIGGAAGAAAAVVVGLVSARVLRRLEPAAQRRARELAEANLPFALDLVAACLRSGLDPTRAADAVGSALGGEVGNRLLKAANAGAIGAPPEHAWEALMTLSGGASAARRVTRAVTSGTELASTLAVLAADLRTARLSGREAAVRRAAVLVVVPLGLCFLPAFVCLSVIPVATGLLSGVLTR